ncbi:MAG: alpha/beta hydrolase, partial [Minwuiales bacterium]|nr:alpha/beta hydrolase [Minwuiales bacterium]
APRMSWPCLVVRGRLSRILSEKAAQAFADTCPNGTMQVVENAGHSVQEDNPHDLARVLAAFWRDRAPL